MRVLRVSTADEMVAEFLRAEVDSPRWPLLPVILAQTGLTRDQVVRPNLSDAVENWRRGVVLSRHRGWPALLFEGWPNSTTWHRVALSRDELDNMYYADVSPWLELSGDSLRVADAARRIRENDPTLNETDDPVRTIRALADLIRKGHSFPLMMAAGPEDGNPMVMVEGHSRMTAYLVAGPPEELEIIYATAPLKDLRTWRFFPKPWPRS
jgi:hypothetical protein